MSSSGSSSAKNSVEIHCSVVRAALWNRRLTAVHRGSKWLTCTAVVRSKQTAERNHVSTHQTQKVCHMQQPSLSLAQKAERGIHGPSMLNSRLIPHSHPVSHCKAFADRPTTRIRRFLCLMTRRSISFPRCKGLMELHSNVSGQDISHLQKKIKEFAAPLKPLQLIAAFNANGCRPSRHSIFSVFECFLSTGAVTASVPMCAVLSSLFRFSVRISTESTRSRDQTIGQCRCRIRPAPRLSTILLAELLSVPRTHCATFSPSLSSCFWHPTKLIHV